MVLGGHVPAVAIVVGAIVGLSRGAGVGLTWFRDSLIEPLASEPPHRPARIAYHYQPDPAALAPPD